MKSLIALLLTPSLLFAAASGDGNLKSLRIDSTGAASLTLRGKDARQQVLVTAGFENKAERDFTRRVQYTAAPEGVVKVDASGLVTAVADGSATITATSDGVATSLPVKVEKSGVVEPINFPNQIVPIFTKASCNSGGCHGKASGQNGFKLSLLGFEPGEDYEHLVKEALVRVYRSFLGEG